MLADLKDWLDLEQYDDTIDRVLYLLAWLLRLAFPLFIVYALATSSDGWKWRALIGNVMAIAISLVPRWMERRSRYRFPAVGEFSVVLALFLEMVGRTFNLYEGNHTIPYDKFSHGAIVGALTTFIILLLYAFFYEHKIDYDGWFIVVVGLLFGYGIGALWESYEWLADMFLKMGFQSGNGDTMSDMVAGAIGALIGTVAAREYRRRHTREQVMDELPIFYEWL